ncbi:AAA family ATPase [Vibrio fluvialis]
MIKNFGFKNFSSFKNGAEISFEFDGNTPEQISMGETVGTVLGIKGANGSGKTNILKALSFLYCFVSKRMNTKRKNEKGQEIIRLPLEPFFASGNEVTEFYIELISDGITYFYELDVTQEGIVRESIIRNKNTDGSKDVLFIERNKNEITHCISEYNELKKVKLKEDQSIITLVSDYNFHSEFSDLKRLASYFDKISFNVGFDGMRSPLGLDVYSSRSEFYFNNPDALEFVTAIIKSGDDGIDNIRISSYKDESGNNVYFPVFTHIHDGDRFALVYADESMGTKTLFNTLFNYWFILKTGGLLICDEFDIHLHAMILPEIIALFLSKETNANNSQLIITAHNTEVMDALGRYRTILVNKEGNESYCYRLDEVSMLRNDRPISPLYKKGKIGGVPKSVGGIVDRLGHQKNKEVVDGKEEF